MDRVSYIVGRTDQGYYEWGTKIDACGLALRPILSTVVFGMIVV
jgi:hypothetical protein